MKNIRSFWFSSIILIVITASMPFASKAQVKKAAPPPALVGSGGGVYHFKPGSKTDNRTYNKLDIKDYLIGQIVVNFTPGKECGGSLHFWKDPEKKILRGVFFVEPGKTVQIKESLSNFNSVRGRNNVTHEVYIGAEFGGIRFRAKECSNSYTYTAYIEQYERYVAPKPYTGTLGTSDYYDFRYKDYKGRHNILGPTDYYKEFGEKYYNRFMNETYLKVSPKGKQFLNTVGRALQQKIEDKLKANPVEFAYLEMNNQMFKNFAFGTHPDAYCESGWGDLDQSDRDIIIGDINQLEVLKYWKGLVAAIEINRCVKPSRIPL